MQYWFEQATAAVLELVPSSQTRVRNASNAGYQENSEEPLKYFEVNNGVLRGA